MRIWIETNGEERPPELLPHGALVEDGSYVIGMERKVTGDRAGSYAAYMGGERLDRVELQVRDGLMLLRWAWRPGFRAGWFDLVIRNQDEQVFPRGTRHCSLRVVPSPEKVAEADYRQLLADLERWAFPREPLSPSKWRAAPGKGVPELEAGLEFLTWHWAALCQMFQQVISHPRRSLQSVSERLPWSEVTELTEEGADSLLDEVTDWVRLSGGAPVLPGLTRKTGGWIPATVADTRPVWSEDTPENRFVARFLAEIEQSLMQVLKTGRSQAAVPASRLNMMRNTVRHWRRNTWLNRVSQHWDRKPTVALITDPVYGALWSFYRRWQKALQLRDDGGDVIGMDRTYKLYEYWCLVQVALALAADLGADIRAVGSSLLSAGGDGLRIHLQPETESKLELPGARLYYQRRFPTTLARGQLVQSVSAIMAPDITVEWIGQDGQPHMILFDAKYRVGHAGLVDGIRAMHAYRDALVDSSGRRVVAGAYMLCPREPQEPDDGKYLDPAYLRERGLGALILAPGAPPDAVAALVRWHACSRQVLLTDTAAD